MNCPVCNVALTMTERQGVEIDYCPQCRGVWLDRGELDKIIERTASEFAAPPQAAAPPPRPASPTPTPPPPPPMQPSGYYGQPGYPSKDWDDDDDYYKHHKKRKKKGFLGELFDFD